MKSSPWKGNPEKSVTIPDLIGNPGSPVGYVYIMASKRNGTLYIGSTSDLVRRVWEHKNDFVDGFTKKYGVHTLVYYEAGDDIEAAAYKERQLKKWNRQWKLNLIEQNNPEWKDLYDEL